MWYFSLADIFDAFKVIKKKSPFGVPEYASTHTVNIFQNAVFIVWEIKTIKAKCLCKLSSLNWSSHKYISSNSLINIFAIYSYHNTKESA